MLSSSNYSNIKAEAYGLRAFLHFDLLRLFGWGDLINTPENLNKLCIPYVTEYSKKITKQSTVKEVLEYIHKDLDVSEELLKYYGFYHTEIPKEGYELINDDHFYDNRQSSFNYRAAVATSVRVLMWEGKYKEALKKLDMYVGDERVVSWVNADKAIHVEEKERDLTFSTEHIFNLNINNMYEPLKQYIENYQIHGDFTVSNNLNYFYTSKTDADELYEINEGIGISDYRYMVWYEKTDASKWLIYKFYESPDSKSPSKNLMPIIRKPEMFYYAVECNNELGNITDAIKLLNEVRIARGMLYDSNLPTTLSKEEVNEELWKEWRKEYVGEGQLFYQYKRIAKKIPKASVTGDKLWIMPLPSREVEIGGREDYKKKDNE